MSIIVDLNEQELADIQRVTKQSDPVEAVQTAVREYIRHIERMELIEMAGRIEIQGDWEEWERSESGVAHGPIDAGSH